jgi:hypothetical protein
MSWEIGHARLVRGRHGRTRTGRGWCRGCRPCI